jgi:hypothetical protein
MKNKHVELKDKLNLILDEVEEIKEHVEDYSYTDALERFYKTERAFRDAGHVLRQMMGLDDPTNLF